MSKTTPIFLADGVGSMFALPICIGARDGVLRTFEWIGRNSVLSLMSFNLFRGIQHGILAMHASKTLMVFENREGSDALSQARHNWEPMACK